MFSLLLAVLLLTFELLPCDAAVVDLVVIEGKHSNCPRFFEKVKHISDLNGNLNHSAGGKHLWLCVRYGTISKVQSGITDLNLYALKKKRKGCGSLGKGWSQIRHAQGATGNLNQGAGGYKVYLCHRREPGAEPIIDLKLSGKICDSGMNHIGTSDKSNGNFNQKAGGKGIWLCARIGCIVKEVEGKWEVHGVIVGTITETWERGTSKTHLESMNQDWSKSVSIALEQGWKLLGGEGKASITGETSSATSKSYSDEFEESETETFEIVWTKDYVGLTSWQFRFESIDSCSHVESTLVREFALTPGTFSPPCCVPGFATDAPYYTTCFTSDSMIENGEEYGCKVDETPALSEST